MVITAFIEAIDLSGCQRPCNLSLIICRFHRIGFDLRPSQSSLLFRRTMQQCKADFIFFYSTIISRWNIIILGDCKNRSGRISQMEIRFPILVVIVQ